MASGFLIGLDKVKELDLLHGYNIEWKMRNTQCKGSIGISELLDMWSEMTDLDIIIGDACSVVCQPAGQLAAAWGLPMISWGCASVALSDKETYPTFTRPTGNFNFL